jgi:uncharacterized membrane protein YqjE
MGYSTAATERRAVDIRHAIDYGTKLILMLVGIGLFRTELLRIISLPQELNNELYLVLLAAATLLTAGWIFVANKEFEIMCDFLDPLEYDIPNEIFVGLAIAAALTILLYTARNPLWFGISYSAYMLLSVIGWTRVKREMDKAIKGSREKLLDEPEKKRDIYGGALDILYSYYVRQANLPRVWTSFALGLLGLMFSVLGLILSRAVFNTIAYVIFVLSILAFEGGLAFYWRFRLYAQVRPFETAKHDLEHPKHHKRGRQNQQNAADSHDSRGSS